jgi:hypothetical protein
MLAWPLQRLFWTRVSTGVGPKTEVDIKRTAGVDG